MRVFAAALSALSVLASFLPLTAIGAPFVLDPTQSFLTIGGTINTINGPVPIAPQLNGSLTDYLSGTLLVDLQAANQLRIVGSSINGVPRPGPFQPSGSSADFAFQAPNVFQQNSIGYAAIASAFAYATSNALALDGSGSFSTSGTNIRFTSNQVQVSAPPFGLTPSFLRLNVVSIAAGQGSISQVDDQYRLVVPFQGSGSASIGAALNMTISGQFVAYRPIAGALAPDIVNGGFESSQIGTDNSAGGWVNVAPGTPNNYAGIQTVGVNFRPQATEGVQEGFINVENGTASMYQTIFAPGTLQPHTQYAVTFDVGNRDLTDNGNLPNNDMDPFISVKSFFTLGNSPVDFALHVGESYQLAQLSNLQDGTWSRNNTIVLDTSLLTPEQLAQPLNFVFQATSATTLNRGQVDFDNVRLTIVPEPSTYALAALGVVALMTLRRSM